MADTNKYTVQQAVNKMIGADQLNKYTTKQALNILAQGGGQSGKSYSNQKVANLLKEGSNVTLTFDSQAETLIVAATDKNTQLSDSQVESIIKGFLKAGNNVSISNGTISATDKDTHLSDPQIANAIANKAEIAALDPASATAKDIVNALQA